MKITLLTLFLLVIYSNAFASLTIVQHTNNGFSLPVSTTWSLPITATGNGNLLVAGILSACSSQYATISSVSDGTNNFTQFPNAVGETLVSPTYYLSDVWYLPKSNSAKTTITVNLNTSGDISVEIWEISGFTNPIPDVAGVVNNGTDVANTDTGAAVITTSTTGFVVGENCTQYQVTANPAAGNEFTSGGDIDPNHNGFCSLISSTAASHQPTWTDSTNGSLFVSSTAAFKEGGATSSTIRGKSTIGGNSSIY